MNEKRKIQALFLFFSLLLQGVSTLQYRWQNPESYVFDWTTQYYVIAAVSMAATLVQYHIRSVKILRFLFFIRYMLLMVIHFPVDFYIGLKLMFFFSYLLDLSLLIPFPVNAVFSLLSYASVSTASLISGKWALNRDLPDIQTFLHNTIYILLAITIFTLFRYFFDRYTRNEKRIDRQNQTIKKLTDANSGFQHYIRIIEEKSTEDERNRIIREIHDSIGYTLTTVMMLSRSIIESKKDNLDTLSRKALENIESNAQNGLNDMRIVLRILKKKKNPHQSDLIQLCRMVKAFEKATDVKVNLEVGNTPNNFRDDTGNLVFRLIQEGMINALRHGRASEIGVSLFKDLNSLYINIEDDGIGYSTLNTGIGLKGIEERVYEMGGEMDITGNANGVRLSVVIPGEETAHG